MAFFNSLLSSSATRQCASNQLFVEPGLLWKSLFSLRCEWSWSGLMNPAFFLHPSSRSLIERLDLTDRSSTLGA